MIEDLDGAASEPSRRTHVAVLSGAVAAVSLVLLLVLVVPAPRMDTPPVTVSAAPSLTTGTIALAPDATWIAWRQRSPLVYAAPLSDARTTWCVAAFASHAPLQLVLFDGSGQPMAAYRTGTTGQSLPPRPDVWAPFTVTCNGADVVAPRINRAR